MNLYSNQGAFTGNTALVTTQVLDVVGNMTGFYVVRWASRPFISQSFISSVVNYVLIPADQKAKLRILEYDGDVYPYVADEQRESDYSPTGWTAHA